MTTPTKFSEFNHAGEPARWRLECQNCGAAEERI